MGTTGMMIGDAMLTSSMMSGDGMMASPITVGNAMVVLGSIGSEGDNASDLAGMLDSHSVGEMPGRTMKHVPQRAKDQGIGMGLSNKGL